MGKILRVDLTTGTLRDENLPEVPILKKFIGGQALALYILLNELPLDARPFGPENIVVIMTGPLTGNGFTPGGTKMTAVYLSPLTSNTLGRGATSGYWGTLSQGRRIRWNHSQWRIDEAGLSLHRRRQSRAARRGAILGLGHPR
jgi:aldehyde:ferredoxin oxidoreductase